MNFMDLGWMVVLIGWTIYTLWHRKKIVKMEIRENFHLKEMGVNVEKWKDFCHLAAYRRTSQTKQLGEAVSYFVEHNKKQ